MRARFRTEIQASGHASRWLAGGALGLIVLVAAACSSGGASPSSSTSGGGATTAASAGASASASVKVVTVGSLGPVLVAKTGKTLYRYTPDSTNKSVCTGGCAALWPPLTVPAGTTHATGSGVDSSDLGIIMRSDGTHQITYKGMPLYTYTGDTKAGDASGEGVGGTWFVIKSTAASTSAATSPPTTAHSSGGYGY